MNHRRGRSRFWLVFLLLLGALGGFMAGQALVSTLPFLGQPVSLGVSPPFQLDVGVAQLTFGFLLELNFGAILGALLGVIIYYFLED